MDSITTMTAKQYRLPAMDGTNPCLPEPSRRGMSVEEWCGEQGITKATYYYPPPLCPGRPVWKDCGPGRWSPVSRALMAACQEKEKESSQQGGLDLEWNHYTIHVTVDTDPSLLASRPAGDPPC